MHTLKDLESRAVLDAGASVPARLAVIGHPVKHSASPRMHQPALDAAGIPARYIKLEIEPGAVEEAFRRMRALGFIGCNVTVPHKLDALAACDVVDEDALALGAVNTVRFEADGTIRGFNTDAPGFARAIADEFGENLCDLRVLIVGAGGGAGQAIATQCARVGVRQLVLLNRNVDKLVELGGKLAAVFPADRLILRANDDAEVVSLARQCDLIVNTTSLGLKEGDGSPLPEAALISGHMVYDTIYQPAVTPLLAMARHAGARTANGLSMLLHQGVLAFQHWFPGSQPEATMRKALFEPGPY